MNRDLEFRQLGPEFESSLADLFGNFEESRETAFFAPHPFTPEHARAIACYEGGDFYSLAIHQGEPVGYGFLRGWDEGYDIPSLGLAIHPGYRGVGMGQLLMHYLHTVATLRGCTKVRLRVHKENRRATRLYQKLGYDFQEDSGDFLLGFLSLKQSQRTVST